MFRNMADWRWGANFPTDERGDKLLLAMERPRLAAEHGMGLMIPVSTLTLSRGRRCQPPSDMSHQWERPVKLRRASRCQRVSQG